ncbi:MAG: HEAT repeat domain-containing protein, partial [Verrucomicrobiota bacterium]
LYVADWYNPIIQHGEVDFRDERRDHVHGRIWRITAKGRDTVQPPDIAGSDIPALLDLLKAPEAWTRDQARRILKERLYGQPPDPVTAWIGRLDVSRPDDLHHLLEGYWLLLSLDVVNPDVFKQLVFSDDHRARAAAVRSLYYFPAARPETMDWLKSAIDDPHPQVRLEAVCALRQIKSPDAAAIALRALDHDMDPYLDFALWLTARELKPHWMPIFVNHGLNDAGGINDVGHLVYAIKAVEDSQGIRKLVELWQQNKVPEAHRATLLDQVAQAGGPNELRILYDLALKDEAGRDALLTVLEKAARERKQKPAGRLDTILQLAQSKQETTRSTAVQLAGWWKVGAARAEIMKAASDTKNLRLQRAGTDALARLGGGASRDELIRLAQPPQTIAHRIHAVSALSAMDHEAAAPHAVEVLADSTQQENPEMVYDAFLAHQTGPAALAKALKGRKIPADVAALGIRRMTSRARKAAGLVAALQQAGGLQPLVQGLDEPAMNAFAVEVARSGNAQRGENIYRRQSLLCMTCHAIGGSGGLVGPDMTSLGASAPVDYIVDSLLEPNKKIKEGYHVTTLHKKNGEVAGGIMTSDGADEIILRDGTDQEVRVATADVARKEITPVSLMPAGLTGQLRRDELVDLVRFLSELGKSGPYQVSPARLVRTWQVLGRGKEVNDDVRHTGTHHITEENPLFTWNPAYSRVNGDLHIAKLDQHYYINAKTWSFVRFRINVLKAGKALFRINDTAGLEGWIGTKKFEIAQNSLVEVPAGEHVVSIGVVGAERNWKPLRIELAESPDADAQVDVIGGK